MPIFDIEANSLRGQAEDELEWAAIKAEGTIDSLVFKFGPQAIWEWRDGQLHIVRNERGGIAWTYDY